MFSNVILIIYLLLINLNRYTFQCTHIQKRLFIYFTSICEDYIFVYYLLIYLVLFVIYVLTLSNKLIFCSYKDIQTTGLPQSQEYNKKKVRISQKNGGFKKTGKVRKIYINMLSIRKYIININYILLILFSKKFCFSNSSFLRV